jgi:ATP-binding cassette, subfamily C (CFTR/MRP), member 1
MNTYLLDDPLSAVDSGVGHHLLHQCLLSQLAHRTRILVTHQLYPLPHADRIVVLRDGKISVVGTYPYFYILYL